MIPIDRFLSLYLFYPLLRFRPVDKPKVPVLMYHSISDTNSHTRRPYYEVHASPIVFRAQMAMLKEAGYASLFPCEIHPWLNSPKAKTGRAVCLTFDDAYEDFVSNACPILDSFGLKSTVFVPTGLVGGRGPAGHRIVSWAQIHELAQAGINIGSHSVHHPAMETLHEKTLRQELLDSKSSLENYIGREICDFSHPFSFPELNATYVNKYRHLLAECGYKTGMTTTIGCVYQGDDIFTIRRLPINDLDDSRFFKAKLNAAYDWVAMIQYLARLTKARHPN
jgi:peptidoglycan/xylan/chitin deacetylase (PgdA/CDA1 family)